VARPGRTVIAIVGQLVPVSTQAVHLLDLSSRLRQLCGHPLRSLPWLVQRGRSSSQRLELPVEPLRCHDFKVSCAPARVRQEDQVTAFGYQCVGARTDTQPPYWSTVVDQSAEPDPWFDQAP
jgi:hypothetical protein